MACNKRNGIMNIYRGEDLFHDVAVNGIHHQRRACFEFRNIGIVRSDNGSLRSMPLKRDRTECH
jgi:hypothetical protein